MVDYHRGYRNTYPKKGKRKNETNEMGVLKGPRNTKGNKRSHPDSADPPLPSTRYLRSKQTRKNQPPTAGVYPPCFYVGTPAMPGGVPRQVVAGQTH